MPESDPALDPVPGLRRPLVGLAVAGIVGAATGLALPATPVLWWMLGLLSALLAVRATRGGLAIAGAHLAVLAVLALAGSLERPDHRPLALARLLPADTVRAEAVGVVDGEPAMSQDSLGRPLWRIPFHIEGIRVTGGWQTADDRVVVIWAAGEVGLAPALGDRWVIHGLIQPPAAGARSPRSRLRTEGAEATRLQVGVAYPIRRWCERGRAWCGAVLGRGLEDFPREAGLLRALVLGYRQELPPELFQAFSRTGTLHVIAVSGSHVAIFAGIVVALLRAAGLARPRWIIGLAPALLLYCLSTGLAPSAIRACVMALMFWSATLFHRRPDGPTALGFSALLILLAAPGQVRDPGFVLSFAAVAGLMVFYPPLRDLLRPPEDPPPGTPPPPRWQIWGAALGRAGWRLLAASVAAWLVTTPLTMAYFNLFSPSGLLLNLAVIPLAGVILFAGTFSLLLAPFSGWLLEAMNHAARLSISVMVGLVERVDAWPGSHFFVAAPPAWLLAAWAGVLVVGYFGSVRARRVTLALLVAGGTWAVREVGLDHRVRGVVWASDRQLIGFLDLPGGRDVLLDAGSAFRGLDVVRRLRAEGVDRLGVVVLTRARADAAGGLSTVLDEIPVGEVWHVDGPARSQPFAEALAEARRRGVAVRALREGDHGVWPGGLTWAVGPAAGGEAALSLHLARGPAALWWEGGGGAAGQRVPAGLWISAQGRRTEVPVGGRLVLPRRASLQAAPAGSYALDDGDALRWSMADDRRWRVPQPAWQVASP